MLSFQENHEIYDLSDQTQKSIESQKKEFLQLSQEAFDFHFSSISQKEQDHEEILPQMVTYSSRLDQVSANEENLDLDQYFSFPFCSNKKQFTPNNIENQKDQTAPESNQVILTSCFSQNIERSAYNTTNNLSFLSQYSPFKQHSPQENDEFITLKLPNESLFSQRRQDSLNEDEKSHMNFEIETNNSVSSSRIKRIQLKIHNNNDQQKIMSKDPNYQEYDVSAEKDQLQATVDCSNDEETQKLSVVKNHQLNEQQEANKGSLITDQVLKTKQKPLSLNQAKQNIHKGIMNAFKIVIKQKEKIKSLLSTNLKGNIDNQIKQLQRYLRARSFNHQILKYLMEHEVFSIIFKHFIFFECHDWLEKSKIQNKELAIQVINSLKNYIENKGLLRDLTCYKKEKRKLI